MLRPVRERNVEFGYVDQSSVVDTMARQVGQETITAAAVADAVPKFTKFNQFTTFNAEYHMSEDGDVTVHFFLPPEIRAVDAYWTMRFPKALDRVAREHFAADAPRLRAKYTEEFNMNSWWFKAQGYGHIINIEHFIHGFFEKIDAALESGG